MSTATQTFAVGDAVREIDNENTIRNCFTSSPILGALLTGFGRAWQYGFQWRNAK